MRAELQALHQELKTTTIYVTHDQAEAMTLGNRVAVMRDGVMQQYDNPQTVYNNPVTMFVAGFMGSPAMNFLSVRLTGEEGRLYVVNSGFKLKVPQDKTGKLEGYLGREVVFGLRPENLKTPEMAHDHNPEATLEARVRARAPLGDELLIHAETGGVELVARLTPQTEVAIGQRIALVAEMEFMHIFDKDTEEAVC
ncbi:MAG: sn-glycerol-3-phosphate import ATP-binding protein UgpC [Firmicutes bacterium]|nr:sn-glycerol-3-phosphate import ATP-binding protein UgpC [Bacillota bacterium]